jgi:hypothetical protein
LQYIPFIFWFYKFTDAFKFLVDVKLSLIKLHSEKEHLSGDFEIFGVDPPQLAEIQNMEKVKNVIFLMTCLC